MHDLEIAEWQASIRGFITTKEKGIFCVYQKGRGVKNTLRKSALSFCFPCSYVFLMSGGAFSVPWSCTGEWGQSTLSDSTLPSLRAELKVCSLIRCLFLPSVSSLPHPFGFDCFGLVSCSCQLLNSVTMRSLILGYLSVLVCACLPPFSFLRFIFLFQSLNFFKGLPSGLFFLSLSLFCLW